MNHGLFSLKFGVSEIPQQFHCRISKLIHHSILIWTRFVCSLMCKNVMILFSKKKNKQTPNTSVSQNGLNCTQTYRFIRSLFIIWVRKSIVFDYLLKYKCFHMAVKHNCSRRHQINRKIIPIVLFIVDKFQF